MDCMLKWPGMIYKAVGLWRVHHALTNFASRCFNAQVAITKGREGNLRVTEELLHSCFGNQADAVVVVIM